MPYLKNGAYRLPKRSMVRSWSNSSHYPDAWARPTVEWLCEFYEVITLGIKIRNTISVRGCGRAWLDSRRVSIRLSRRNYRDNWSYIGIYWDKPRPVYNALEAFVFLTAHEIAHVSTEGQAIFDSCRRESRLPGKRDWRKRMEVRIQDMAQRALDKYRESERVFLLREYAKSIRRERAGVRARKVKVEKSRSAEGRISRLEKRVEAWESKRRRAENAIRKLKRSLAGMLAAQRRAALRGQANGL